MLIIKRKIKNGKMEKSKVVKDKYKFMAFWKINQINITEP